MIDVTDVMGMLPDKSTDAPFPGYRTDFEPAIVRIFHGEEVADGEFCWPFDELPETD
jgi:hypothetical protein